MYMIEVRNLVKTFKNGSVVSTVLKGINCKVESGEFVAIMGRSGAGKSTFMYQMSLLDEPTSGEIVIDGRQTQALSERERMRMRLNDFGYVFQDYALLPELNALENAALPLIMQGIEPNKAEGEVRAILERIAPKMNPLNVPSELSGGEQQRVSIARAVTHKPKVLFADEPTANLDRESSELIIQIFKELHAQGQTIIMVTHEEEYGKAAQRIIHIDDGKIIS